VNVTGLVTPVAWFEGEIVVGAMFPQGLTLVVALALLSFPFGSLVAAATDALSPALLPLATVAVMVSGSAGPAGSDGIVQTTVRLLTVHDQPFPEADCEVTPKRLLATRTFCATSGPLFTTFSVKVTMAAALTGFGLADIVSARSAAPAMATVALPEAVHDPLVTVMLMMALPLLAAVQVIDGVPLPLVIVPPVIVQL